MLERLNNLKVLVGIAVVIVVGGLLVAVACVVETRWKADQPQPAASVVKLLIALDLLDRSGVPSGGEATAVHSMLAATDDRVASRLWQQNGGPDIVRRQAGKLGLAHTTPPAGAGQWGSTRMSPTDVVTVYRHITAARTPRAPPSTGSTSTSGSRAPSPVRRGRSSRAGAAPSPGGCSTPPAWSGPRPGPTPSR
ncbi:MULTISPECIES: hypothetical protein [unclassified Amycolatopsis]|uniref:hypothetical protein n=1 Tax=unclassified Amycolatopsis TaxID=2618356 RepID=UPI00287B838D|nr:MULTISPECIES: hypothetical protein [unclassified Amycolatopsis]